MMPSFRPSWITRPPTSVRAHAASCAGCAARLEKRQDGDRRCSAGAGHSSTDGLDAAATGRTGRRVLLAARRDPAARRQPRLPSRWRRAAWSGAAVAVATLVVVLFVVPMVKGPATVSAAEILAKSANRLAQTASAGVELLEYELVLDGVPREMMPDQQQRHVPGVAGHRSRFARALPLFELRARRSPAHVDRAGSGQTPAGLADPRRRSALSLRIHDAGRATSRRCPRSSACTCRPPSR